MLLTTVDGTCLQNRSTIHTDRALGLLLSLLRTAPPSSFPSLERTIGLFADQRQHRQAVVPEPYETSVPDEEMQSQDPVVPGRFRSGRGS